MGRERAGWLRDRVEIDDTQWRSALRAVSLVAALAPQREASWRALSGHFLATKAITGAAGFEPDATVRLLLSMLCCEPLIESGPAALAGWHQLIVYPEAFRVTGRVSIDESTGVETVGDDVLSGEAWTDGPMVLAWGDVAADLERPVPGCNVAAHEMAHKIDRLDGVMDGTPPFADPADVQKWVAAFKPALESLRTDLDQDRPTPIDPYAATGEDEFFAVATEYWFSAADPLSRAFPAVARCLQALYGPSPRRRIRS